MLRTVLAALVAERTDRAIRETVADSPGLSRALERTNHAGRSVTLAGGVATSGALIATNLVSGAPEGAGVVAAAGALGALDDFREDTSHRDKGLRGHFAALRAGRLTTGAAKAIGISTAALVTAVRLGAGRRADAKHVGREPAGLLAGALDFGADAALIAGGANLTNLLDLRPGRALKAALLPLALATVSTATRSVPRSTKHRSHALLAGTAAAVIQGAPDDLAGRSMLGDTGANALGAHLGWLLARSAPRCVRLFSAGGVVALILASERVSFSAAIENTPWLQRLDLWGRA
ncbi:MAG: hypothetical protein Q4P36_09110 [Bowdeniella nasicola]|nr:hypothetical protein [Bowdeniella nasicola]